MKKRLRKIIIFISIIAVAVFIFIFKVTLTKAAWYSDWTYRRSITLSHASGAVTDYQMKILVGESSKSGPNDVNCNGHCKTDFSDLRFTNSGGTSLNYWIESVSGTTPAQVATVWVKFDSIGTGATTFYVYYGNASATAVSNGYNTFIFFDDFSLESTVSPRWGWDSGNTTVSGDECHLGGTDGDNIAETNHIYADARWRIKMKSSSVSAGSTYFSINHNDGTDALTHDVYTSWDTNFFSYDTKNGYSDVFNESAVTADTNYHVHEITRAGATAKHYIDNTLFGTNTNASQVAGWIDIGKNGNFTVTLDWVFISQFTATEPAWGSWGTEEVLTGPSYRKSITLSRASGAVTNYQMKVLVGESSGSGTNDVNCDGHCKTNFYDLRFTNSGGTLLNYWIESVSGTTPNQVATAWVKFDSIGTGATTFYMYYGNSSAIGVSNGAKTFILFDDFLGNQVNGVGFGNGWYTGSGVSVSGGEATISNDGISTVDKSGTINQRVRAKVKETTYAQYASLLAQFYDNNDYIVTCPDSTNVKGYFYYTINSGLTGYAEAGLTNDNAYHVHEQIRNSTTSVISSIDDAHTQTINTNIPTMNTNISFSTSGVMVVDWVSVSQYLSPEPTWGSWGSAETAPVMPSTSSSQKGLVGWWKFDGNAKDSSPYGDNGAVTGATLTTDRKGQADKAYSFNGSTNYVTVPSAANLDMGTHDFSISTWIKTSTTNINPSQYDGVILSKTDWIWGYYGYALGINGGLYGGDMGKAGFFLPLTGSCCSFSLYSNTYINDMAWHQITVTVNRTGYEKIYIDGKYENQLDISSYSSVSVTNGKNLLIGYNDDSQEYFPGSIDDVRIYNRVLSQGEITSLYGSYNPGIQVSDLQKGLVAQWKMDGNAKDSSPNGNNGTAYSLTPTTDRKGTANKAYNFTTSSAVDAGNGASLGITGDVSIGFWIKTTQNDSNWTPIVDKEDGCGSSPRAYLMSLYTGRMFVSTYNCGGLLGSFLADGMWHHVVGVLKSGMYYLYLDGKADGSQAAAGNPQIVASNLVIGAWAFTGTLDDVRIYNRGLSAAEAKAWYEEYDPGIQVSNLQKGLVGQWKFEGNAKDSTPYGNNGTVYGATLTTDRKGQISKAYSFSDGNYIGVPDSASLTLGSGVTVEAWVNASNLSGHTSNQFRIADKMYYPTNGWYLRYDSTGSAFQFSTYDGTDHSASYSVTPSLNTWYHVVGVSDGINNTVYVNGVAGTPASSGTLTNSTNNLEFSIGVSDYSWNGSIDGVRIWNRALSAAEVKSLYDSY